MGAKLLKYTLHRSEARRATANRRVSFFAGRSAGRAVAEGGGLKAHKQGLLQQLFPSLEGQ